MFCLVLESNHLQLYPIKFPFQVKSSKAELTRLMIASTSVQALQTEANFRYSLVRVRDNVESIAFYGGESHESATIKVV